MINKELSEALAYLGDLGDYLREIANGHKVFESGAVSSLGMGDHELAELKDELKETEAMLKDANELAEERADRIDELEKEVEEVNALYEDQDSMVEVLKEELLRKEAEE